MFYKATIGLIPPEDSSLFTVFFLFCFVLNKATLCPKLASLSLSFFVSREKETLFFT